ncbi:MAG: HAMP domain-containing protein [Gemmatimonadetes bacterium]|nr:HAMP domain-containing protein [Gemmatimonadota bacterium]
MRADTMLSKLKFGQKIVLMPALAGLGSLLVIVVALVLGGRSQAGLTDIEVGYSPSLESSRTLEQRMAALQRALQDAVAAADVDGLTAADALADSVRSELAQLRSNPVVASEDVDALSGSFESYFRLARETSVQMITGASSGDLMTHLRQMTDSYTALTDALEARTEHDRKQIAAAFESARGRQSTTTTTTVVILLAVVLALTAISYRVVRGVLSALGGIAESAEAIARGDIDQRVAYESGDEIGRLADAFRGMIQYVQDVATAADGLARGDLTRTVQPRSDKDVLARNMARATQTLTSVLEETSRLIRAAQAGSLAHRGNPAAFEGAYGDLVRGTNAMMDALVAPIEEASQVLASLARGDLRAGMRGAYQGRFAELEANLNTTVRNLADALGRIRSISTSVSASSGQLRTMSMTLTGTAEATTRETAEVSKASDLASSNVQMVASAAEEMSSSIREISTQVQEARSVADEAARQAENTVSLMDELGTASTQIGEVVRVITSIAEQTNLLALNATIEAARAGEAGKGFAVVANEVKQLASQTAKATEEISAKIRGVQERTGDAVKGIRSIAEVIGRVNQISLTVASAVEQQSAAVGEIARSASEASHGTEQVARSIASVSQAALGSASGAEELQESAHELAGAAATLDSLVGGFHLTAA